MKIYSIVYLISNVFNLVVLQKFMQAFFRKRVSPLWVCISTYFLYYIVTITLYLKVDIPLLTLSANIILIFIITMNYESTWKVKCISTIFILFFLLAAELLIASLSGYSFTPKKGSYDDEIGIVCTRIFSYMIAQILCQSTGIKKQASLQWYLWIMILFVPISTIFLAIIIFSIDTIPQVCIVAAIIIIFLFNVIVLYFYNVLLVNYEKLLKAKLEIQEKEAYKEQCRMMKESTEEMQRFRHDINNQLIVLEQSTKNRNTKEISLLISELLEKSQEKVLYSTTGNLAIDSIVNYKLQKLKNCKVYIEIVIPEKLAMDISDLVSLIGNLFDNALEALEKERGEKEFFVKIVFSRGRLLLQFKNTCTYNVLFENKKLISTKKEIGHGYGTKIIKEIVEKYGGDIKINYNGTLFETNIIMYI